MAKFGFTLVLCLAILGACRPSDPLVAVPATPPVALTPTEYNNTIADLFGFPRDGRRWPQAPDVTERLNPPRYISSVFAGRIPQDPWPWHFPSEPGSDGYEGIVQGQEPSAYLVEELQKAAKHFATYALVAPRFFVCEDWPTQETEARLDCAWTSIRKFTHRAYRRPISDDEQTRLQQLWEAHLDAGTEDEAVALTVAGILQSPHFLYRIERSTRHRSGGATRLSGWELASRLSYFLWDTMPDEQLFRAADSGALGTPAGLEQEARRMLEHPRARQAVTRFHHQWLGTEDVLLIEPARRAFGPLFGMTPQAAPNPIDGTIEDAEWPATLGPVRHALRIESELFVENVVFDGAGTFTALMTDNHGYTSKATMPIYGDDAVQVEGSKPTTRSFSTIVASTPSRTTLEFQPTLFPESQRSGVLTQPAVLALGAYAVQPGPILRGKRVLERFACMELGPPIQGAEEALPPDTLAVESTNRERTHEATKNAPCSACHQFLNPPGFAFENYDALGKWRDMDNGQPVDASGSFVITGGERLEFQDGVELARKLAADDSVRDCYALHWTRYALGNHVRGAAPGVSAIQAQFRSNDSIKDLLVSIATSDIFRNRTIGDVE